MCLAAPAAVLSVNDDEALVDLDGVRLTVSRVLTPEVRPGDIVLVHVGFILSAIDPAEAEETLRDLKRASLEATP
jgi:hydrogenase expression/formation protein HypC